MLCTYLGKVLLGPTDIEAYSMLGLRKGGTVHSFGCLQASFDSCTQRSCSLRISQHISDELSG